MKKLFFLLLVLSSCTSNLEMKNVHYDYLINDGNSKVWMIDQMVVNKTDISAQRDEEKELLIFYKSNRVQYIPLKELGHKAGKVGDYILSSQEKELTLFFKESKWKFKLAEIAEDSIYLTPMKGSGVNFSLQLVPLKELFFE